MPVCNASWYFQFFENGGIFQIESKTNAGTLKHIKQWYRAVNQVVTAYNDYCGLQVLEDVILVQV